MFYDVNIACYHKGNFFYEECYVPCNPLERVASLKYFRCDRILYRNLF